MNKAIVIHSMERTLANYKEESFNMAKNDMKQYYKFKRSVNDGES